VDALEIVNHGLGSASISCQLGDSYRVTLPIKVFNRQLSFAVYELAGFTNLVRELKVALIFVISKHFG
jgi:hypothetical protein